MFGLRNKSKLDVVPETLGRCEIPEASACRRCIFEGTGVFQGRLDVYTQIVSTAPCTSPVWLRYIGTILETRILPMLSCQVGTCIDSTPIQHDYHTHLSCTCTIATSSALVQSTTLLQQRVVMTFFTFQLPCTIFGIF